ncbi:tetratricopeptide repeat protein [Rhodovarius crocodyli]|nr:tetratricopeptide repeat protein [Rhodovarius crocodyli]
MTTANDLVARGAQRHKQGKLMEAESLYRRALKLNPNQPDAHNLLSVALRSRGALEEALAASARAVALAPGHPLMLANHGAALAEAGRLPEAISAMQQCLAAAPGDAVTWRNLGQALAAAGRAADAVGPLTTATQIAPTMAEAWLGLAHAQSEAGNPSAAHPAAVRALELAGRDKSLAEQARFLLAALGGGEAPDRAPAAYVRQLFDAFAPRFDAELEGNLEYRTPALLAQAMLAAGVPADGSAAVLDLGCGTGLSGVALAPFARRMEGVDLSPRMLDAARARGLYAALHEMDLLAFLPRKPAAWDVIAAADVLNYLGDLGPVLGAMRAALRPGGIIAFSLETGEAVPYELGQGMRYRHNAAHVRALAEAVGLTPRAESEVTLRMERGKPVAGTLLVLG